MKNRFVLISFIFCMGSSVFADTIELKNGQTINAKVISQDDQKIQVDFNGVPLTYWMDEIKTISAAAAPGISDKGTEEQVLTPQGIDAFQKDQKVPVCDFLYNLPISKAELLILHDVVYNGWKDGSAEAILQNNKDVLSRVKEIIVDDIKFHFLSKFLESDIRLIQSFRNMSMLLLGETEQAFYKKNNALAEADLQLYLDWLSFLLEQDFSPKGRRFVFSMFDSFSLFLGRHVRETQSESFLKSMAEKLQKVVHSKVVAKKGSTEHDFQESTRLLKLKLKGLDDELKNGKTLVEIINAVERLLKLPVHFILSDKIVINDGFIKSVHQTIEPEIERWVLEAQHAASDNALDELKAKMNIEADGLLLKIIKTDQSSSDEEKAILVIEYLTLRSWISENFMSVYFDYFFSCQAKVTYLGILEKLFEMQNNRSLGSLNELIPRYLDALPEDDFSDIRDFIFYNTSEGRRICGVGIDRADDHGKVLLTIRDLKESRINGDICFSF